MIFVIATLRAKPGMAARIIEVAKPCIEGTRKEKGCISYDIHQSQTDPDTLVFVERWESRDNLAGHMQEPHFKAWRAGAAELIADRKIEIITPEKVDSP